MFHSWLKPKRRSKRQLLPKAWSRLAVEQLENRVTPANLQITGLLLVDAFNRPITAPTVGERVYLQAKWNATVVGRS